ncbi:ribonuclease P protein subunit p14 isoform X1 [Chlorocebus sabaeus]|uniref:ribonuclease P protein subunit p14 isoform X1 n=1 Tax=Chlorocebus sabaeus TaxID=60711 RepID=UPI003BFA2D5F
MRGAGGAAWAASPFQPRALRASVRCRAGSGLQRRGRLWNRVLSALRAPGAREFQDCGVGLNAAQFKQLLISAVKDLFGEVDAALPLDILTYEEKTLSAILRICSSGLVKLWSSLTLLGSYKGKKCAFRVIQVSPFLLALSGNSRELVLD